MLRKMLLLMLFLSVVTGCTTEEIKEFIEEKHIVDGEDHNFITFADEVFKKGGEYMYKACYTWNNKTECDDRKCLVFNYVYKRCVKNGTDDLNTHTYEEWNLFDDCCDSICHKLNYSETNTIANEFGQICFCQIPDSPLRIEAYFDVNKYRNYTNSCNLYVEEQYGKFWVNRE